MVYNDKQIGKNIKAIRNANKKSLLDFAGDIGISDSLLGKIETGSRHATDEMIHLISNSTGFSYNDIKYKDLTSLEKGYLYFEEEIKFLESEEMEEFSSLILDQLKIMFPIAKDEKCLTNKDFSNGISIAYEKIISLNCSSTDCIKETLI